MRRWASALALAGLTAGCGGAPTAPGRGLAQVQAQARAAAAQRAPVRPIMVFTPDAAWLFDQKGGSTRVALADPQVDLIRTIALLPRLGWWTVTDRAVIDARTAVALARQARTVKGLQAEVTRITGPARDRAAALLEQVHAELDALSRSATVTPTRLAAFVQRHRALSDQLLADAASLRLARLRATVEPWWRGLDPAGRATLRAVVIDTPARRAGHLTVQYLARALGASGEGERVQYREGGTVAQAIEAVERRADAAALGSAGYGDALHLQQDPLAPGGQRLLEDDAWRLRP